MLSPEYLTHVAEGAEKIAEELHGDIINRIIERIMVRLDRGDDYVLTALDKWQIEVLEDAGFLLEDIQKEIAKKSRLQEKEIKEAMEEAGVRALEYDDAIYKAAGLSPKPLTQSPYMVRLMQRSYEATMGEWYNFTRTTAEAAQRAFIGACDTAYNQVASGSLSYTQAVQEAVEKIAKSGAEVVYYTHDENGVQVIHHTDTIETATLRAVRTGISQATAQITDARMEEMDWDTILVSSHFGARVTKAEDYTNHYWWQGKFYSKSGKDPRFPPFEVCGMGDVQGIHGAGCRHSHGPGDGEFNPYEQFDSEENRKRYELEQKQRSKENRIRKSKQEAMGLKTAMDSAQTPETKAAMERKYQRKAATLKRQNTEYRDFCKENDLKELHDRLNVAKWDRKQAAAARGAATKYENRNKV